MLTYSITPNEQNNELKNVSKAKYDLFKCTLTWCRSLIEMDLNISVKREMWEQ